MKVSRAGIEFIKFFEGCNLRAYRCPGKIWTIGYGHTENVYSSDKITKDEAEYLLCKDIAKCEAVINKYVTVSLSQGQFDALVSFVFNLGELNFRSSTLLKKLNSGQTNEVAKEFERWNRVGGQVSDGLSKRRLAESKLFSEN